MIYKKVTYNGVSLWDSQYSDPIDPSYLILQDMDMVVNYETKSEPISVYHGSKGGNTIAKDRLFRISGIIIEVDPEKRQIAIDYLKKIIKPEGILSNNPNHKIEWQDFKDRTFWSMARVNSELRLSHQTQSPIISFSFDLWSETPQYFGSTLNTYNITPAPLVYGLFSGGSDGVHLGSIPDGGNLSGGFIINNLGNFEAGVEITDKSQGDGVFYMNNTNGLRYGVTGVSMSRIINTMLRSTIVTDYGIDNSKNRMKGSTGFLLSPGSNAVSAGVSNYDYSNPPVNNSIVLKWYDTYI